MVKLMKGKQASSHVDSFCLPKGGPTEATRSAIFHQVQSVMTITDSRQLAL